MAQFKKSAKKTASSSRARAQARPSAKSLSESAQQVWLAGVGAFGRAQAEGAKLFETLVKEGMSFEQTARKLAGGGADAMRDVVENRVGQARDRATDTWDKLEKVFEDRVQRALNKLGVPGRDDLNDLARRVEQLTAELRKQGQTGGQRNASRTATGASSASSGTPASKKSTAKAGASKRAGKKTAGKSNAASASSTASKSKTPSKRARKTAASPAIARPDTPDAAH